LKWEETAIFINPLLLVPDKKVRVNEDFESDSENPTYMEIHMDRSFDPGKITRDNFTEQNLIFELWLNVRRIEYFYRRSRIEKRAAFDDFKFAFLVKELALIRCGTVEFMRLIPPGPPYSGNQVWEYIFSLLELRRSRYRLSCELPAFSRYAAIYSACVRKHISMEMISRRVERFEHALAEFSRAKDMLEELYALAALNRVPEGSGLSEYALPFLLAAEHGDIFTSSQAATAIYNYILMPNEYHGMFKFRFSDFVEETEEILDDSSSEELPEIKEDDAVGFYRDVLIKRMENIVRIRNVFKRIFTMTEQTEVFDGDVDLRKQQRLYISSLTAEEDRAFLQRRFKSTTMDVVVVRDISFSTDLYKLEYAEAIVAILASLDAIASVRTAQIDFSDFAVLNKGFDQRARDAAVAPRAFGGTLMGSALELVGGFSFRAARRLVFIVTDGEIEDMADCSERMKHLSSLQGLRFFTIHITPEIYGDRLDVTGTHAVCGFNTLDRALYHVLMRELRGR
jgi:hypothetical protein